jgi:hypothetical protein
VTFHFFAFSNVLVFCDLARASAYARQLIGL